MDDVENMSEKAQDLPPVCHLLRLPVELRLEIYEELLQHDGLTRKSLYPQILTTCKQIHEEAQKVVNSNSKRIALAGMKTSTYMCTTRIRTSTHVHTICIDYSSGHLVKLDDTVETMTPMLQGERYLMVYVELDSSARSWKLVNQQLYLLVTAATLSRTVRAIEVRLKKPLAGEEVSDYAALLWPLSRAGPNITIITQGCPPNVSSTLFESARATNFQLTELSLSLILKREIDETARLVEEAGIRGSGIRFLPRTFPKLPSINGDHTVQQETEKLISDRSQEAWNVFHQPKWQDLKTKALAILEERKIGK